MCLWIASAVLSTATLKAAVREVGAGKQYATPCQAFAAAADGDIIEIQPVTYAKDVCRIAKNGLVIRGVGGRAIINAQGTSSGDKAAWVIAGSDTTVENIEFTNVYSTAMNGAGIRAEGRNLTIRNCRFYNNQMGILTTNNAESEILIEYSEFGPQRRQDGGLAHNMYINHIRRFTFRYSYSHHSSGGGHLLKSRARETRIMYSRLTSEQTGAASYELSVPNGGLTYVVGNIIQQGPAQRNPILLTYFEEGTNTGANPDGRLFVVNNTFVNDHSGGTFIKLGSMASPAVITNNLFVGPGTMTTQSNSSKAGNVATLSKASLLNSANYDYRLQSGSPAINAGVAPPSNGSIALAPAFHYVHPLCAEERRVAGGAYDAGAYEYGDPVQSSLCASTRDSTSDSGAEAETAKPVLSTSQAAGGKTVSHRVDLDGPAPAGGALVTLTSSHPSVVSIPTSVLIPQGQHTAPFSSTLASVSVDTTVTISASYRGTTNTASMTVKAEAPEPAEVSLVELYLSSSSYISNQTTTINYVRLNTAAPAGGATVSLSSSHSAAVVPKSVFISAGSTRVSFTLSTQPVTAPTSFSITASYSRSTIRQSSRINPLVVSNIILNPRTVDGGTVTSYHRVYLNGKAPAGGAAVTLSSSNTGVATVPQSVTVPEGQNVVYFPVTAKTVSANSSANIKATLNGGSATKTLTVTR